MATAEKAKKSERYQAWNYEMDKFTGLTTFHGLVRLYHASWLAKVFWLSVIAVAVSLFFVQMVSLFQIVSSKPTVSQVRFNFSANGTRFPVVTVCNYNPVSNAYVQRLNSTGDLSENVLRYIMISYLQVENLNDSYSNATLHDWSREFSDYKKLHPHFDVAEFFRASGQSCESLFKSCSFGGKVFPCCDFAQPVLTDIGQCYQFNNFSVKEYKSRQFISGVFYGLQLIMDVNRTDYTDVYQDNFFEVGIRFFVHSDAQLPYLSTGGLSLSPQNRLYAGITPVHFSLLPKGEWGDCKSEYEQDERNELQLDTVGANSEPYTASNCEAHCVSTAIVKKCDCVPMRYKTHDKHNRVCEPVELLNCLQKNNLEGIQPA